MTDSYKNYIELASAHTEGVDYKIKVTDRKSDVLIIAPHGGKIEPSTSKIANMIAGEQHSLYLFEGLMPKSYKKLHITSTNFDEPQALALVGKCSVVVGVHGRKDKGDDNTLYLGGRDDELVCFVARRLRDAEFGNKIGGHAFPARNCDNICNRGRSGRGVQIETPKTLRRKFCTDPVLLDRFSCAIRSAIEDRLVQSTTRST